MQFRNDVNLNSALASPHVTIKGLLEVDWARDGNYANTYSDLSSVIKSVNVDFAAIHGNLPADVNTVVGTSSGVMAAVVNGFYTPAAMRVSQMLSKYYTPSPLLAAGITVEGTPIRYSRRVLTPVGFITIRQFTGWITDYLYSETDDTTTINCSDVYDVQQAPVTLPVWAVGPPPGFGTPPNSSGQYAPEHPMSAYWPITEVLRQAGRSIGPVPRPDAVVMWSEAASMLPMEGYGVLWDAKVTKHAMAYFGGQLLPTGNYGVAPYSAFWDSFADQQYGHCRTQSGALPSNQGSTDGPRYIGFCGWFSTNGTGGATGIASVMKLWLDSETIADPGYITVGVYPTGAVNVTIHESAASGSANAGTNRQWVYFSVPGVTAAWHLIDVSINFTNSSMTPVLRMDGTILSWVVTPANSRSFTSTLFFTLGEGTNHASIELWDTPMQYTQIYYGGGTYAYDANQGKAPWEKAGLSQPPAQVDFSFNYLNHMPDVQNEYAWDVLKSIAEGEFSCLFTREDGQIWFMNRFDVELLARLALSNDQSPLYSNYPTLPGVDQTRNLVGMWPYLYPSSTPAYGDVEDLSRAKISGININPSAITYRNQSTAQFTSLELQNVIVWQNSDPKQFYADSGSVNLHKDFPVTGIQSIFNTCFQVSPTPSSTPPVVTQTSVSSVDAASPTFTAAAGWVIGVGLSNDQRTFDVGYGAGLLSPGPIYVGATAGANSGALEVGGLNYGPSTQGSVTVYSIPQVALRGVKNLNLPTSEWLQDYSSAAIYCSMINDDTIQAAPVLTNLSVPVDPRRQLLDVVKLPPSDVVSGDIYAQVMGKRISDTASTTGDFIDVRVMLGNVIQSYWDDPTSGWDTGSWGV